MNKPGYSLLCGNKSRVRTDLMSCLFNYWCSIQHNHASL